jgi:MFS family permease
MGLAAYDAPRMTSLSAVQQPAHATASQLPWTLVACLGLSQLVCWGTLHYLIALFASPIGEELGWTSAQVQAGFSLATLVMAGSSYFVGRWIDVRGGREAMMAGCWLGSLGCGLLSLATSYPAYLAAWMAIGLGMRLALYDAAFATLARIGGASAKRAMSFVTVVGGLASSVFWPLGQQLLDLHGWRGALQWYAALLAACSLLHLAIPRVARTAPSAANAGVATPPPAPAAKRAVMVLYAYGAVGVLFLQTGMAAHFIGLLRAAGWLQAQAVWLATLLGVGQFTGRIVVASWAWRFDPVALNLLPAALQVWCFTAYLATGDIAQGAMAFAFLYGLGNGLATYTRGAMPLVLFDPARYGRIVGLLLKPALALAALAPVAFGYAIERWGAGGTAAAALALAASMAGAAGWLAWLVRRTQEE